jgi:hypothetical protein
LKLFGDDEYDLLLKQDQNNRESRGVVWVRS